MLFMQIYIRQIMLVIKYNIYFFSFISLSMEDFEISRRIPLIYVQMIKAHFHINI